MEEIKSVITAKEKAVYLLRESIIIHMMWNDVGLSLEEIKTKYFDHIPWYRIKDSVTFFIDEIINSSPSLPILGEKGMFGEDIELSLEYWKEVKKEIDLL